jgi:phosphoglycerate dehydrogenase-like enzyme
VVAPLRVVVSDPIIAPFRAHLEATQSPHDWVYATSGDPDELAGACADADVLVLSKLAAPADLRDTPLRLAHVTGAGIDRVDLDLLPAGIPVCNTGHHGRSIAEQVIIQLLKLRRRALAAEAQRRAGEWRTVASAPGTPYHRLAIGDTIGVIGTGEIGCEVAALGAGLGMRAIGLRRDGASGVPAGSAFERVYGFDALTEFLGECDVVVVCAPLTDATRGMIDRSALHSMRPNAHLINVARAGVLDEDAVAQALADGTIAGAALDVWWGGNDGLRAPESVARFASLPNTVLSPHHSGHAEQVFIARARDIAHNIDLLAEGSPLERQVR